LKVELVTEEEELKVDLAMEEMEMEQMELQRLKELALILNNFQ